MGSRISLPQLCIQGAASESESHATRTQHRSFVRVLQAGVASVAHDCLTCLLRRRLCLLIWWVDTRTLAPPIKVPWDTIHSSSLDRRIFASVLLGLGSCHCWHYWPACVVYTHDTTRDERWDETTRPLYLGGRFFQGFLSDSGVVRFGAFRASSAGYWVQ